MENEAWPQSRRARLNTAFHQGAAQNEGETPRSVIEQIADMISDDAPGCPACSPVNEPLKPPPNFNPDAPLFSSDNQVGSLPEPGSGLERLKDKPQSGIDLTGGALGKDAAHYTEKLRDLL